MCCVFQLGAPAAVEPVCGRGWGRAPPLAPPGAVCSVTGAAGHAAGVAVVAPRRVHVAARRVGLLHRGHGQGQLLPRPLHGSIVIPSSIR